MKKLCWILPFAIATSLCAAPKTNPPGADTNAPAKTAAADIPMHEYAFPDGTGSIQLPDGWKTSAQTCIHGVQIQGPADQTVSLGVSYSVNTPDSFIVQNQIQMAAQARQMLSQLKK